MKKRKKIIWFVVAVVLLGIVIGCVYYLNDYYKASRTLEEYQSMYSDVTMVEEDGYYVISREENATDGIIFYQGGKVEVTAYLPLMHDLAVEGYTCFLVKMPFQLAVFGINKGDEVIKNNYNIETWYMGGHSLGGAMASSYVSKHQGEIEGLFLLGAYTASDLSSYDGAVVSIYGENDGIMNKEKFEDSRIKSPSDTTYNVIAGGNHSGFGDYGSQDGDGYRVIEAEVQRAETVEDIILGFKGD